MVWFSHWKSSFAFEANLNVNSVHCPSQRRLSLLHITATFLFLCERKHPPPSCAEHVVIGRCPDSGCSDRLPQTVLHYSWLIICCRSHPHQPAREQSGTVEKERKRGLWVFLAPLCLLQFVREWAPVFAYSNVWICFIIHAGPADVSDNVPQLDCDNFGPLCHMYGLSTERLDCDNLFQGGWVTCETDT